MQTRIVDESQIDEKLDAELRRGLSFAFPRYGERFDSCRYIACEPAYRGIIQDGDAVVAQVAIIDRTVTVGGQSLRVAGVGLVYVLGEYRGQGHSGSALAAAMGEAKRRGYDFGMLFTGIEAVKRVYLANGWLEIPETVISYIENDGSDAVLGPERAKMYFVLDNPVFPSGDIYLKGNRW